MTTELDVRAEPTNEVEAADSWQQVARMQYDGVLAALPAGTEHREEVAARFIRSLETLIRLNPEITDCTKSSVLGGALTLAQCGLEVSAVPQMALGYLVPFNVNRNAGKKDGNGDWLPKDWVKVATPIVSYRGILELANRSEQVGAVTCNPVYKGDTFEFDVATAEVHHTYDLMAGLTRADNDVVGVYCLTEFLDGTKHLEVVPRVEIDKHHQASPGAFDSKGRKKNRSPWTQWYPQMVRKTGVRVASPFMRLSSTARRALASDSAINRWDGGEHDVEIDHDSVERFELEAAKVADTAPEPEPHEQEREHIEVQATVAPTSSVPLDEALVIRWKNYLANMTKADIVADYEHVVPGGKPVADRMGKVKDLMPMIANHHAEQGIEPPEG